MDNGSDMIKRMHEEQGREIIEKLQKKIDTTRYNLEVSEEIIAETPSDEQREKLTQKNIRRQHGIAGIEKEIRDIEQELEK
ncbi:MAG: small, acid-soluble spore protein tlp [Clostridiaceae bacterium]|nr:small, acid-soluble spore protein tlp [Clostridiaceae bacterium]